MKTEVRLAETLKRIMNKESLDTITVKRLSDLCNINRQTFYYHFRDIYDLLTWIFLNENIKGIEETKDIGETLRLILKYIEKNFEFVKGTLDSAGQDLFNDFLFTAIFNCEMRFLTVKDSKNMLINEEKRFIANYCTSSLTSTITRWVKNDMKEDEEIILKRLEILRKVNLDNIILEFKKLRGGKNA